MSHHYAKVSWMKYANELASLINETRTCYILDQNNRVSQDIEMSVSCPVAPSPNLKTLYCILLSLKRTIRRESSLSFRRLRSLTSNRPGMKEPELGIWC